MKTFIRGFLTTLLIVTFTLIPLVMYVEKTINEDLLGAYLEDTISDNLKENMKSEEVFDLTEEEQQALEEEFENNESLQEFVNKYKDQILKDINSSEVNKEDINFEEDVRQLLLDNKELIEKTTGKTLRTTSTTRISNSYFRRIYYNCFNYFRSCNYHNSFT